MKPIRNDEITPSSILFWVRHGESFSNVKKIFSFKQFDRSLTAKGELQAQQTADYFKGRGIQCIYSSPLKRALETARIIGDSLGLDVTVLEDLREVNVGKLDGQPMNAEHLSTHKKVLDDWFIGKHEAHFPDGENYLELSNRLQNSLKKILADQRWSTILVIGHGGSFKYTLKDLCPTNNPTQFRYLELHNCSITEIIIRLQMGMLEAKLVNFASTDHLYGPAANFVAGLPNKEEKTTV